MTETTKKTEQSPKPVNKKDEPKRSDEIADKDLDKVAGGPLPPLIQEGG